MMVINSLEKQYVIMSEELKNRIKDFNKIKTKDNSKIIIMASLNTEIKKLEWGVTQASNNK